MKIVLTYAVAEEYAAFHIAGVELIPLCIGIGKVSAAHHLTRAICEHRPDAVINIGSVGTLTHRVGDVLVCNTFVDRDLQKLGALGITYRITFPTLPCAEHVLWSAAPMGVCNTGDSFLTEVAAIEGDVVDMEGFAQAAVCQAMGIPFVAVKYVTDIIGENSVKVWKDKLRDARTALAQFFMPR